MEYKAEGNKKEISYRDTKSQRIITSVISNYKSNQRPGSRLVYCYCPYIINNTIKDSINISIKDSYKILRLSLILGLIDLLVVSLIYGLVCQVYSY